MILLMNQMPTFNSEYWDNRYKEQETAWDLGKISQPIKTYADQLIHKDIKILIPGAGNSYEAEYLWKSGFKNIYILDIATSPLISFKNRVVDFPESQIVLGDFFDITQKFDLILEQTFFCALPPEKRQAYAKNSEELLNRNGKIAGVLFDFPFTEKGPPFGGSTQEYELLFKPSFHIKTLERCYNSETTRENKELFVIFEKRNL